MATATVLAPSAHYQSSSSFPSSYPRHASGTSSSTMMSLEPRRSPDDNNSPRQSLPSISEVISGTRPSQYPSPAHSSMQTGSGLPSPFPSSARSYDGDKHPSPQHSASSFPPRQDTLPAFSDSPRPAFNGRPSLPPVADRRPTPPKSDIPHHHMDSQKPHDAHTMNSVYAHQQPHHAPPPAPYQPSQLPPGQVPLPRYPPSPRHPASHMPSPYDPRAQQPMHPDEVEYSNRARYEGASGRHLESWSYQESLSRIGSSSRTVFNFAEAYGRIAQEQHGAQPHPERLPTEREVGEMLANVELIKRSLEQVRDVVQISIQSERAREGIKAKGGHDEDGDVAMYGDGMKPQFGMAEVKKRRGRAAPPGRCHSCNRIDTPEWRRGPDGARTLCNACGLHYAKLERKRQLEARSLRPKPEDRN